MGLLDDAIREHLELKRRSGADPGEIAHKEHEALAPVFPDEETIALEEPPAQEQPIDAEQPDFTHVGQETAELDMSEVLDVAPDERPAQAEEDSLEWEMAPGIGGATEGTPPPHEIPGQERLTFE